MRPRPSPQGFSLLELSVVLVIIGLLAGSVMVGQSMINAAELRSVATDYRRFATAAEIFHHKYESIPGDMKNATAYWGKDNTYCPGATGTAAAGGVCNGNSDGIIGFYNAALANQPFEQHQLWRHLAAAGMVEGSYTGVSGANSSGEVIPGTNSPLSKITGAGWSANGYGCGGYPCLGAAASQQDSGNYFVFGAYVASFLNAGAALTPANALSIDAKIDDGKPAVGMVLAYPWTTNTCTTATSATDLQAKYYLSNKNVTCSLFFVNAF